MSLLGAPHRAPPTPASGTGGDPDRARLRQAARTGLLLSAAAVLAACAATGGGSDGPVVSPTGKTYEPGTEPEETRYSQTAELYLRRERPRRALERAREGVASDPENPIHYFHAGVAHARLGEYAAADSMLGRAEEIYPAYELQIEPVREATWAEAYNAGTDAYAEGDVERAIELWRGAATLYDLRPRAHRRLARALIERGRAGEAVAVYRDALQGLEDRPATRELSDAERRERSRARAEIEKRLARLLLDRGRYAEAEPLLRRHAGSDSASVEIRRDLARTLSELGRPGEADSLYRRLLEEPELEAPDLLDLGVASFRAGRYERAREAFSRLTEMRPNSRDAWYNYANTLFAAGAWSELTEVGPRLRELDPLGENAGLIVARGHLEAGEEGTARRLVKRVDAAPIHLDSLELERSGPGTGVRGRVVGNAAEPGTSLDLRFVFYGPGGAVARRTITLTAPPPDSSRRFAVSVDRRADAYRYEVVSGPPAGDGAAPSDADSAGGGHRRTRSPPIREGVDRSPGAFRTLPSGDRPPDRTARVGRREIPVRSRIPDLEVSPAARRSRFPPPRPSAGAFGPAPGPSRPAPRRPRSARSSGRRSCRS